MTRPRKPFGATHPGRLPATMMKVLAAEMSDPSRLRKGKQYARDGSVLDIEIAPGIVACEVQGSRPTPYVASIEVTIGDGMPLRRDVRTRCSCPDDDNWDGYSCKHVVAAMFCFSDELLLEPELLDVWRGRPGDSEPSPDTDQDAEPDEPDDEPVGERRPQSRRHLRLVGADDRADNRADSRAHRAGDQQRGRRPAVDPLIDMLAAPVGSALPPVPDLERMEPVMPRDPQLAAILRDALASARVDWD